MCAAACVVFVGILEQRSRSHGDLARWRFLIADPIWEGAYWALVSSAFVHAAAWHLIFNVYWLWTLGSVVERALGPLRYLAFVIVAAAVSSACELAVAGSIGIGGSGVVYAFVGMMWLRRNDVPAFKAALNDQTINLFWIWLIGCMVASRLDWIRIGNAAHVAGLLFGVLIAQWFIATRRRQAIAATFVFVCLCAGSLFWNPWSPSWVAYQGYRAHKAGAYDEAIASYRRSIALGGSRLWALENIAYAQSSKGAEKDYSATIDEIRSTDPRLAERIERERKE